MKKLLVVASLFTSVTAFADVTVTYTNSDAKALPCKGESSLLSFAGNTTAPTELTIKTSRPVAVLHCSSGALSLKGGETIQVQGGKVKIQ